MMCLFEAALEPYSSLTDAMSMEKKVGICELYPLLLKIQTYAQLPITNEDLTEGQLDLAIDIRNKIWDYMDKRFALLLHDPTSIH